MALDRYDDIIAAFRKAEDGNGVFIHYPNYGKINPKTGKRIRKGSTAIGSFGFLKSNRGHLKAQAWSSPEFADVRQKYGTFGKMWRAIRKGGYESDDLKMVERTYAKWIDKKAGGDIGKMANFNLTGNYEGRFKGNDQEGNMKATKYRDVILGKVKAGGSQTFSQPTYYNPTVAQRPLDTSKGRDFPYDGGRFPGRNVIKSAKQQKLSTESPYTAPNSKRKPYERKELDYEAKMSALDYVAPFATNAMAAFQQAPLAPRPNLDSPISLDGIDLAQSKNNIDRQLRTGNISADERLDANSAIAAKSNLFARGVNAKSNINQQEQIANVRTANQERLANASIDQRNNAKLDQYNIDNTAREIAMQNDRMTNLYDVGDKIAALRQQKLNNQTDAQYLQFLDKTDYTGASNRAYSKMFPELYSNEDEETQTGKYGGTIAKIMARRFKYKPIR